MLAYKFLDAKYGLKSLKERRLKQSRICDLNDPFELTPYDLTDLVIRKAFYQTRDDVGEVKGVLCFSADWRNPVIWAHYSDKHKGLCLGFDIPEIKGDPENDDTDYVNYQRELFPCPNFDTMSEKEYTAFTRTVLFTKFRHWEYENEIRVWAELQAAQEDDLNYVAFGENLRLKEVLIGQKCPLSKVVIAEVLGTLAEEVTIRKARAAYDRFEMVEDEEFAK